MSLNKVLTLTFVFLVIILGVEGFYYINQNKTKTSIAPTVSSTADIQPSPSPKFKIIYQAPDDKEGRTIIYESSRLSYLDLGKDYVRANWLRSIVGIVDAWQSIDSTKDYYLVIKNPLTGELDKVRVGFESSKYFDGKSNLTSLLVENLTSGEIEGLNLRLADFGVDKTKEIIKKGDAVVAMIIPDFLTKGSRQKHRVDNSGIPIAVQLYIRRIKGREMVEIK